MRDSEFEFIRSLVYDRSRIRLDQSKRELVFARIGKRLRANSLTSVADYCRMLKAPEHEDERARLIDVISTNHTFFFRENAHFDFVRQTVVPEMLARSRKERWPHFYAWSAASSSGEEPYTLGMTLADSLASQGWPWRVEATDISHRILEAAKAGIYKAKSVVGATPDWAKGFFQRGVGPQEGNYRIKACIRDGVSFRHLNLLEGSVPFQDPFHLIFCRNVMIYFDRPTQEELVRKLAARLVPGGYLLVGHSESLTGLNHGLQIVQPSVYRLPPTS